MGIISFHLPSIPVRVKTYCGHFTDEEFEAQSLSVLSSVPQLEEQGGVCNPQHVAHCLPDASGRGRQADLYRPEGPASTSSSCLSRVAPTCWAGPLSPSTEPHCLQPERMPASPLPPSSELAAQLQAMQKLP